MGHRVLPIKTDLMLRNIIGRLDGTDRLYRALRVTVVEGEIINVPYLPPGLPPGSPEAFRTLLAYALALGADGNPVVRVHFSDLPSTRPYDAERGAMRIPEYINELFVIVKRADDSEVVCVNLKALGLLIECPRVVEEQIFGYIDPSDILIYVENGTESAPRVEIIGLDGDGGDYELEPGVHFTYEEVDADGDITHLITVIGSYLPDLGDLESFVIRITFGDCEPIEVEVFIEDESDVEPPPGGDV